MMKKVRVSDPSFCFLDAMNNARRNIFLVLRYFRRSQRRQPRVIHQFTNWSFPIFALMRVAIIFCYRPIVLASIDFAITEYIE